LFSVLHGYFVALSMTAENWHGEKPVRTTPRKSAGPPDTIGRITPTTDCDTNLARAFEEAPKDQSR
jgi:hypothetical protein